MSVPVAVRAEARAGAVGGAGHGSDGSDGSDGDGHEVYRHRDPASGVVAEVRSDGLPVGLAFPERLLDGRSPDVAAALLRALVVAGSGARELLEAAAEEVGDAAPGGRW